VTVFKINQRVRRQPAALLQQAADRLVQAGVVGWIEENEVEGTGRRAAQPGRQWCGDDLAAGGGQGFEMGFESGTETAVALDEDTTGGATGQGFQAEGAGTGEQVEAMPLRDARSEPVEKGFPHPVRRGSDGAAGREMQAATAPVTRDYPEAVCAALVQSDGTTYS
jgi:hypothetical protein